MGTDRTRLRWWSTSELVTYIANDLIDLAEGHELTSDRHRRFTQVAREIRKRVDVAPGHSLTCVCESCFETTHASLERDLDAVYGPFDDPLDD